ncbi:MAG: zf-HC2 domain-containing protein [Candidatus Methylomirabilaceae bacterium]
MTPRCQDILERLIEGATGPVPPAERAPILEHLATCATCRREAVEIEATISRLRTSGEFSAPPGFWSDFMEGLDRRLADERMPLLLRIRTALSTRRYAWGTAVATLAVVLAISTTVRVGPRPASQSDPIRTSARGLVTTTMTTTLPSLGEMIDVWSAGVAALPDPFAPPMERP